MANIYWFSVLFTTTTIFVTETIQLSCWNCEQCHDPFDPITTNAEVKKCDSVFPLGDRQPLTPICAKRIAKKHDGTPSITSRKCDFKETFCVLDNKLVFTTACENDKCNGAPSIDREALKFVPFILLLPLTISTKIRINQ